MCVCVEEYFVTGHVTASLGCAGLACGRPRAFAGIVQGEEDLAEGRRGGLHCVRGVLYGAAVPRFTVIRGMRLTSSSGAARHRL